MMKYLINRYDKMFMDIALITAKQSNCVKYKVGCILVKDNRIVLQGYNGTISGFMNCSDKFSPLCMGFPEYRNEHSKWSNAVEVHAEMNIITYAAKKGISVDKGIFYCTHKPCNNCLKHLISSGIKEVIYYNDYVDNLNIPDVEGFYKLIKLTDYKDLEG